MSNINRKRPHRNAFEVLLLNAAQGQPLPPTVTPPPSTTTTTVSSSVPRGTNSAEGKTVAWNQLNRTQQRIAEWIRDRKESVFFTGVAGTGKSFLLRYLIQILPKDTTYVTASTGLAGVAIEGTTLHSFAGIGLGDESVPDLVKMICERRATSPITAHYRWLNCRVLIIDEVSMLSGELFDKLEAIARQVRRDARPFGGIQLILCGDGLQLAPVRAEKYVFDSDAWSRCISKCCLLTQVFRQADAEFVQLLNELRKGVCTAETERRLLECRNTTFTHLPAGILPTRIFTTNQAVRTHNQTKLEALPLPEVAWSAQDWGAERSYLNLLQKECPALQELPLRTGAQVMLLKNLDTYLGLCNGARGCVIGFESVDVDEHPFAVYGKGRGTEALDSGEPVPRNQTQHYYMPLVRFENGLEMVVPMQRFELKQNGRVVAYREQLPLLLAFAITAHKVQGMTLSHAVVDVDRTFDDGQLYVAVSRVKSLSGLQVLNFKPHYVMANSRMVQFYNTLEQQAAAD